MTDFDSNYGVIPYGAIMLVRQHYFPESPYLNIIVCNLILGALYIGDRLVFETRDENSAEK
jgi:hypothetical protein